MEFERRPVRPITALKVVRWQGGHRHAFQRAASTRAQHAVQVHRSAVLVYGILGLSTCLTIIEPAPFELIALPLALASSIRLFLSHARPYTPSSAALVLLLALFALLQVLPVVGGA